MKISDHFYSTKERWEALIRCFTNNESDHCSELIDLPMVDNYFMSISSMELAYRYWNDIKLLIATTKPAVQDTERLRAGGNSLDKICPR